MLSLYVWPWLVLFPQDVADMRSAHPWSLPSHPIARQRAAVSAWVAPWPRVLFPMSTRMYVGLGLQGARTRPVCWHVLALRHLHGWAGCASCAVCGTNHLDVSALCTASSPCLHPESEVLAGAHG